MERAETDDRLAENLGMRLDIPPQLLQDLIVKAAETVRVRLLAAVPPDRQETIRGILASVSDNVLRQAATPRDFGRAVALVDKMHGAGELNEAAIVEFASAGQYEELIAGLARICAAPPELIERLLQNTRHDGILIACKAAELRWPTFSAILKARFAPYELPVTDLTQARTDFLKLSVPAARRLLRFWLVRGAAKAGGNKLAL